MTGHFVRNGMRAEWNHPKGYLGISIKGKSYLAHRVAWQHCVGLIPKGMVIDHINRDKSDNRIDNLRVCTNSQNASNRAEVMTTNTSGFRGVSAQAGKWLAYITHNRKRIYLGYHRTPEDAAAAHMEARKRIFGDFA